jgi:hypothetical protein
MAQGTPHLGSNADLFRAVASARRLRLQNFSGDLDPMSTTKASGSTVTGVAHDDVLGDFSATWELCTFPATR